MSTCHHSISKPNYKYNRYPGNWRWHSSGHKYILRENRKHTKVHTEARPDEGTQVHGHACKSTPPGKQSADRYANITLCDQHSENQTRNANIYIWGTGLKQTLCNLFVAFRPFPLPVSLKRRTVETMLKHCYRVSLFSQLSPTKPKPWFPLPGSFISVSVFIYECTNSLTRVCRPYTI